ncbi:cadherin-like domain-containing protein [Pseudosulfitobacter sp. SM2401]|uniref:cadherin-like domain-containing protein n=1 Tax=Pseudosulfitobacter sp. SM2401 TaxID=3350098 RepID=UPI0036F3BB57
MTTTVNFNELATGTIVDNEYQAQGVTISATGGSGDAMIFDTSNPTGGDGDLATTNLGNVLIISEDGDSNDPDDNGSGGTFHFAFDDATSVEQLTFLDLEQNATVRFFDENGTQIGQQTILATGDNGQSIVDFNTDGVYSMQVTLAGSGAVDNLVFDQENSDVELDGIVEGTNDAEVIDVNYTGDPEGDQIDNNDEIIAGEGPQDDIVDAFGGNDTIVSGEGNDDIYAGSGDDSVDGGSGDDLIYGDSNLQAGPDSDASDDKILDWGTLGYGTELAGGASVDTGGVTVNVSFQSQDPGALICTESTAQHVASGETFDANSSLMLFGAGGEGGVDNTSTTTFEFDATNPAYSDEVQDVSFRINDLDTGTNSDQHIDIVTIRAYDAAGNLIPVTLTNTGTIAIDGNTATGADGLGSDANPTDSSASLLVNILGPVAKIEIDYDNGDVTDQKIWLTDVHFSTISADVETDDGEDGNDTLLGGIGEDSIYGEGGDDRIEGGVGDDFVSGGTGNDFVLAGDGNDSVMGDDGNDTLCGQDGDDTLLGGIGNDVLEGMNDNDVLFGGAGDDRLYGDNGNDELTGGEGADSIYGGRDADTIFGGAGDVVDGGSGGFNADPALNTDDDTLDLTGQGPFILENVTTDGNGNGTNGTVVFVDGAGNPTGETLAFTEIENIVGDDVTNTGPVANDDVSATDEDVSVVVDLIGNDTDADGDALTVISATVPADQGTLVDNGDGTVTFTPADDFNGEATISYEISDSNGGTDTATHTINVAPVNDGPDAVNDADVGVEDTAITVDLLANDTDVENDDLTVTGATVPADQGTLVDNGDGTVTFTPADDFNGVATISYSITDGNGGTDTAIHEIDLAAVNDGPVAVDDLADTMEEEPVIIDLIGNDTDVDGDPLTIGTVSVPADQGTVVDNGDGTVTFSPAENFNGPATITYTVIDGEGGSDEGQAIVSVGAVNDGPTANDDSDVTDEDVSVTVDLIGNDTDEEGDALTVTGATVPADQGTLVDNGDGTVTFTPADDFNGTATISYSITDGNGGTDSAIHEIEVASINDDPVAVDDIETTDEDQPVIIDLIGNDTDVDGDPLTIGTVSVPADQGTVVDNGDGTVTFSPAENFNGPATITYTVIDGEGGSDEGQAIVSVGAVNDGPVANDDVSATDEDVSVVVDLIGNDTDADGDALTVISATVPADQGTLVDNGDGTVTFTPADDFNGEATISYEISDSNGGTDTATHTINVAPVNDGPDAVNDADVGVEDTAITVDLLANDTDVENDDLTVTGATVPADQGTLVDNGDGTVTFTPADDFNGVATISYSITDGNGGTDTAIHEIDLAAVNDGPVAVDDLADTMEEEPVIIDLIGNDTDVDGDPLTIGTVSVPADQGTVVDNGDGTVTFSPAENFNGPATITYTVIDGEGGSDEGQAIVSVGAVNDGPTANDDSDVTDEDVSVTVDLIGNDTDEEGDALTVTGATVPADQGTLVDNGDGTVTFTPADDFNGTATISYSITDGNGGTDSAIHEIEVASINDDPVAVDDIETTDEDQPVIIDLIGNDTDVDGDPLTIGTVSVPADQGTVVDNGDGTVTFSPAENFNGPATITYTVIDGEGGSDEGQAIVSVGAVNDGPVANDDVSATDEDVSVVVDLIGNDTDADGDALTVISATVPADQGTLVDNGDGTVTFTPADDFNGEATISYEISDSNGGTDTATHTINVAPVNDGPDAQNSSYSVLQNETAGDLDGNAITDDTGEGVDSDPEGDDLTVVAVNGTTGTVDAAIAGDNGGLFTISADGTIDFDANSEFDGLGAGETASTTVTYTIADEAGLEDTATVTFTVTGTNDGPVATPDLAETDEDTIITLDNVLDNDTDADGDMLTVSAVAGDDTLVGTAVAGDTGGLFTINADGSATFDPNGDYDELPVGDIANSEVTYTVTDPDGQEVSTTVTVIIYGVNDAPVAVDDADTTPFNTPVIVDLIGNDTDVDDDPLTLATATVDPAEGTLLDNGDGTVTFTPADGFEGDATITYTVQDGNGGEDEGQAIVTVEEQPLDGIVTGTDDGELIDEDYTGDPEGDMVDNGDNIFSGDPEDEDDDIIVAGGGNDTVISGDGDDSVDGGAGDDRIHTDEGDDTVAGGTGNDTIATSEGDDSVDGGTGDDEIGTGVGSDIVVGGEGNDLINTGGGDLIDKGYPGLFPGEEGTPGTEDDRDFVDGGAGDDTIRTGDDADTIIGGDGNDVIDGGIDADSITGDEGNDRIVGGEGSDSITGGVGNDTIHAGNDPDLGLDFLNIEDDGSNPFGPDLRPDNGKDTVSGGEGDDLITGADDDDLLMGDEGNDTIDGGIDDDTILGGIGNDSLLGGQGNDSIEGGDGDDYIDGGRNADVVDGGDGNDTILGGNGADVLSGGAGDDVIDGGTGDDTINGDAGNDSILGSTGDDVIDGGSGNDTIDGGNGGADIMSGGDDEDLFINVTAGEVVDGGEGVTDTSDFDTLDLTGSAPNNGSLQIVYDPANNENGVVNYFDENGDDAGQLQFSNIENVIPCFTPGTLIATPKGERKVEDLMVGDRIITRDNGIQEIRWVGARDMTGAELEMATHLKPVLIRQGALGGGLPERDMMVSPNHRVLVANDKTALYFEEREVLVAAKFLTGLDGVDVVDVSGTTYIHLMFDAHEVILSDGTWTESFQPGDQTLAGVGDAQRDEILELFPELATRAGIDAYTSARRSLKKHEAALLTK